VRKRTREFIVFISYNNHSPRKADGRQSIEAVRDTSGDTQEELSTRCYLFLRATTSLMRRSWRKRTRANTVSASICYWPRLQRAQPRRWQPQLRSTCKQQRGERAERVASL